MRVPITVRAIPAVAERVWWTPPRRWSSGLDSALKENPTLTAVSIPYRDREIRGFRTGSGPLVILAHGWGGQAAQYVPLAISLAKAGHSVVTVDSPGHGEDTQNTSDGFQMAEAVATLVDSYGEPIAVVGHSLGAFAIRIAFDVTPPPTTVLIAPLLASDHALRVFSDRAQLLPWTRRALYNRFERFAGDWSSVLDAGSAANFGNTRLLIVHDPDDRETPFDTSAALAARRSASFLPTPGLGHSRVLSDESTVHAIAEFVSKPIQSIGQFALTV